MKKVLNTTIKAETLDAFKKCCAESGVQMNTVLEAFMDNFVKGKFVMNLSLIQIKVNADDKK